MFSCSAASSAMRVRVRSRTAVNRHRSDSQVPPAQSWARSAWPTSSKVMPKPCRRRASMRVDTEASAYSR